MNKVAIISSFGEECGVAFYSSRLKTHLEKYGNFQVDVLKLNISLLRATDKSSIEASKGYINELISQMQNYEGIFMQFEPGLYGSSLGLAYKRVLQLLASHKNIVITIHGFHRHDPDSGFWGILRAIYKRSFNGVAKLSWQKYAGYLTVKFWNKALKNDIKILTFCKGDETYLRRYFNAKKIDNFPITYFSQDEVKEYKAKISRDQLLKKYNLDPHKKYIGIFGFINRYKGHLVALKALETLPPEYQLLIIGGEHPHGLEKDQIISSNIRPLIFYLNPPPSVHLVGKSHVNFHILDPELQLLERPDLTADDSSNLAQRVHFIGQVSDEEMSKFYSIIDYVILPYIKTSSGQSASGPAIFAMEFGCKTIFSNAPVFRELESYYRESLVFSGIGNYLELGQTILRYDNFHPEISKNRENMFKIYNPERMVNKYKEMLHL